VRATQGWLVPDAARLLQRAERVGRRLFALPAQALGVAKKEVIPGGDARLAEALDHRPRELQLCERLVQPPEIGQRAHLP
jgi:enoyl-CoA hydratase/carnithine racemase